MSDVQKISSIFYKNIPSYYKYLVSFILLCCLIVISFVAFDKSSPGKCYTLLVGDWLINYSAGFIRRGLTGSLILRASHFFDLRPENLVAYLKIFCYSLIYLSAIWIVLRIRSFKFTHIFLILYQASYMFPLLDFRGSGRKEIILLAIFSVYVIWIKIFSKSISLVLLSIILATLTLVHDSLFWFYPLYLLALRLITTDQTINYKSSVFILLPSASLTLFIFLFGTHASQSTLDKISQAINPLDYQLWNNAIGYITWGVRDQYYRTMRQFNLMSIPYLILGILLAYLPIYIASKADQKPFFEGKKNLKYILLGCLFFQAPLIIAGDWGRWIYVDSSLLTLAYIANINNKTGSRLENLNAYKPSKLSLTLFFMCMFISLYSWRIHHCCATGFELMLFNNIHHWLYK